MENLKDLAAIWIFGLGVLCFMGTIIGAFALIVWTIGTLLGFDMNN